MIQIVANHIGRKGQFYRQILWIEQLSRSEHRIAGVAVQDTWLPVWLKMVDPMWQMSGRVAVNIKAECYDVYADEFLP